MDNNYEWVFDTSQERWGMKLPPITERELRERINLLERTVRIDAEPGTKLRVNDHPLDPPDDVLPYKSSNDILPLNGEISCLTLIPNAKKLFGARIFQAGSARTIVITELDGKYNEYIIYHRPINLTAA